MPPLARDRPVHAAGERRGPERGGIQVAVLAARIANGTVDLGAYESQDRVGSCPTVLNQDIETGIRDLVMLLHA